MRVVIATDAWKPQINGVVRTLEEVVARLPGLGLTPTLITPQDFRTIPLPGYPEIRLSVVHPGTFLGRLKEANADVIHIATEGPIGLAARRAALRFGIPITSSYHTRFPEYVRARLPVPLAVSYGFLKWFHSASEGVLVSTPTLAQDLAAHGFSNLWQWTRGVDLSLFQPRQHDEQRWPRPVYLNVGRVAVEKNLEAFLALDLPGTKVIVGDGPARARLEREFPDAVFLGALTGAALANVYAQADAFVFPSQTDTFGVVLLEALASGLPIAAYPVMGPQDILAGSKAGCLSDDLRSAALGCLDIDRQACTALATRYSWEQSARQFAECLTNAVRRRAPAGGSAKGSSQTSLNREQAPAVL
jgi:glycosyltransferase involved in cell wall biosynthesis